jgi:murein DD-endopeptidase MepM/ murein hydrolase activator NlpD
MPARAVVVGAVLVLGATGCGAQAEPAAPRTAARAEHTAPATAPAAAAAPAVSPSPRRATLRSTTSPARAARRPRSRAPSRVAKPPRPTPSRRAAATLDYRFPVQGCRTSYGHTHHDYPATDIFAARGCRFVSPVAGRVDEVERVDRWDVGTNSGADRGGISVSVVGVDGVRYYGSHLLRVAPGVGPGVRVRAGGVLGYVGDTGSARGTGAHLHFGMSWPTRAGVWWVRRGMLYPWPYLDAWRAGRDRSPAGAVTAIHRRLGDVPPCRSYC